MVFLIFRLSFQNKISKVDCYHFYLFLQLFKKNEILVCLANTTYSKFEKKNLKELWSSDDKITKVKQTKLSCK